MSKLQWKGSTQLAPVPAALVSCGTLEKPNALTIAWTGITCSDPPMTYISVRPERYSYDIIKESGEFVINLTSGAMARATDFCGVRSGREMDKLAATGLTVEPAKEIAAPVIAQSPLALECRSSRSSRWAAMICSWRRLWQWMWRKDCWMRPASCTWKRQG